MPGVQPKGKETMASQLALSLLKPALLTNKSSSPASSKPQVAPSVNIRSGPHITLDISGCDVSIKERDEGLSKFESLSVLPAESRGDKNSYCERHE